MGRKRGTLSKDALRLLWANCWVQDWMSLCKTAIIGLLLNLGWKTRGPVVVVSAALPSTSTCNKPGMFNAFHGIYMVLAFQGGSLKAGITVINYIC